MFLVLPFLTFESGSSELALGGLIFDINVVFYFSLLSV